MNILVDIGHPGHVHLLKNVAEILQRKGHHLYFSVRNIPVAKRLMDIYQMPYIDLGDKKSSLMGKMQTVIHQDLQLYKFVKKHKIDIGLSSGIVLSHVGKFTSMCSINFDDDDDNAESLVVKFGHPFANAILTPQCITRKSVNAVYYSGTHELAYLHPKYFHPDETVLQRAGLKKEDKFFILRFVAFNAYHDVGQGGLSIEQKRRLIDLLLPYGRVIITSEKPLDEAFESYRMPVPPEDIHSLMYYSSMFLGDSQTMTSEAAILGVPALKCNTFAGRLSVPYELEQKYGLCYSYLPEQFDDFIKHVQSILENPHAKEEWQKKRQKFLDDKIDVTAFFVWFVENYPESKRIMKDNPDYQYNFR